MFSFFSYTECESPGPFDKTPGYKIKSAISFESDLNSQLETMNRAIAAFPSYTPPKLDIFTSSEQFLGLDKNWSYSPIGGGSLAFYRLFTSGMARGRPGNPFHQVLTADFEKYLQIENHLTSQNGNRRLVPSDFYFWGGWISPRGDEEVERSQTAELGLPSPKISESDLMHWFELELFNEEFLSSIATFEDSYANQEFAVIPSVGDEVFFKSLSSITRLFPSAGAWALPFSNQLGSIRFTNGGDDSKPIYMSEAENSTGSTWTRCLRLSAENGLMTSVFDAVMDLEKLTIAGFGSQRNLQHLPLALLLCGHEIVSFDERFDIDELIDYCQLDLFPVRFKSEEAKNRASEILDDSFLESLLSDKQADAIYDLVIRTSLS